VPVVGNADGVFLSVVFWLLGLLVLYVVIRFAVRHGIEDAWERRERRSQP
jgi:hypothetical protein